MNTILAWAPGGWQIILIVAVILILFGAKKIPEFAKGLGLGIKEFKKAAKEVTDEVQNAADDKSAQQNKVAANGQQPANTVSQSSNPPKA